MRLWNVTLHLGYGGIIRPLIIVTNLVLQAKRRYMYRFLNPSLPSKVLWKNLESIVVKDSVDANIIYSPAELGSYYEPSLAVLLRHL
jgi:hypothetical protein